MVIPASLADAALVPMWQCVRDRLDSRGPQWRGRVRPPSLSTHGRHLLASLVGDPARFVDLTRLESVLHDLGVGDDLVESLERLGFPLSKDVLQRRDRRTRTRDARQAVREVVDGWPEHWCDEWFETVWKAGVFRSMDTAQALTLATDIRRLLDALSAFDSAASSSRTQLAATVVGSAHALDRGTRLEAAMARALCFAHYMDFDATERAKIWDVAGAPVDLISAPVLTWALPLRNSPLAVLAHSAHDAGLPLHMSTAVLRRNRVEVQPGTEVLLVENPRVIEAAMERGTPRPMMCGNGNPTMSVRLLVELLMRAGATVHCHGDFDSAGLAIVARLVAAGCKPWKMDAVDYVAAIEHAEADGVMLPLETRGVLATPWDLELQRQFEHHRRIVHEERLIDTLLE